MHDTGMPGEETRSPTGRETPVPVAAEALTRALPSGGLFAGREWLWSPEPLALDPAIVRELRTLGHVLHRFQGACDTIYRRSRKGTAPEWIAGYLDAGKPPWMLEHGDRMAPAGTLPRVIRPDLLLTEDLRLAVTELDSVPGGIGLTAWLGRAYAELGGWRPIGGADGMLRGFASILPRGGAIAVSDEAADYRPEMEWLAGELNQLDPGRDGPGWSVERAESLEARDGIHVYRFFELFDHASIPGLPALAAGAEGGRFELTPPVRPHLEEKLWSALLWMRPLEPLWRESLRGSHLERLRRMIPYSWVLDPAPVPHHAVLPRLEANSWAEVARFSQRDRELVLKISGFSELAWGSRSVAIGHDLSAEDWGAALDRALGDFPDHPWVLQAFLRTAVITHPFWDPESGERRTLRGRVRLCPYYFVGRSSGRPELGGVLATIAPEDKKVIHGMRDAVLVPCVERTPD